MASVGIDGGFWTRSHLAGLVWYARHLHKLRTWNMTFNGAKRRKRSLLLVCRKEGCRGIGTMVIRELEETSG